ncbi:hypothetical protein A8F94_02385 [Bacillus sp. FJAT-27225]|uniref:FAD-binding domain-containing protein n=1 Tax=Bacillus sp. FJAT-27225 TaxID=1743144 RepID=UPI00080C2999|nr:FAD-binding domain-containing protein [Bacillus sp. FJAT-27225]OCA90745.1 hypothetical protein A8F94_02385 [Bacillus sp. FJAT-27225]
MNIVWLRKDLRLTDHLPFLMASTRGETLPLYIIEPSLWKNSPLTARHFSFVKESLRDLSDHLQEIGGKLYVAIGEAEEIFELLLDAYGPFRVYVHKVQDPLLDPISNWFIEKDIDYIAVSPYPESILHAASKKAWLSGFERLEEATLEKINLPQEIPAWLLRSTAKYSSYSIKGEHIRFGQAGGETNALETLDSFLSDRISKYKEAASNPLKASLYSSGLSAYLTWGNISMKTVMLRTLAAFSQSSESDLPELNSFIDKLYKRFRLVDKAEGMEAAGDPFSERTVDETALGQVFSGESGIPIVDASILCLIKTGWLPESLRILLAGFLCNTLLLRPESVRDRLAGLMLDFEPVLFTSLFDGCVASPGKVKGKIFDPVKAGKKIDPDGQFISRHLPQLGKLSSEYIHEPWLYPGFYTLDYVVPIIDTKKVARKNKAMFVNAEDSYSSSANKQHINEQLTLDL